MKDKKPDAGLIVTKFKKLKGEATKLQFTVGGSEGKSQFGFIDHIKLFLDRKHELTNSKRDWRPTGPDGGVELDELNPSSFEEYFKYVDVWGWSAVLGSSLVNGHPLRWTMYGLWKKYGFFKVYAIEPQIFFNFADRLERSYGKVKVFPS